MSDPVQEIVEHKVRRAAGLNALRNIGVIVEREQQADAEKVKALRWFARYGVVLLLVCGLLLARFFGVI